MSYYSADSSRQYEEEQHRLTIETFARIYELTMHLSTRIRTLINDSGMAPKTGKEKATHVLIGIAEYTSIKALTPSIHIDIPSPKDNDEAQPLREQVLPWTVRRIFSELEAEYRMIVANQLFEMAHADAEDDIVDGNCDSLKGMDPQIDELCDGIVNGSIAKPPRTVSWPHFEPGSPFPPSALLSPHDRPTRPPGTPRRLQGSC